MPEGEGKVDACVDLGLVATCNPGGAGKWTAHLNKWFVGKNRVFVLEDNDAPGRRHADKVARNLVGIVREVRIVRFTDLPEGHDIKNFIALHGAEEAKKLLLERALAAPVYHLGSTLSEMNKQHAVLPIGGKTRVATWGDDPDFPGRRSIVRFSSFADFRGLYDKYRHSFEGKDKKGNSETVTMGLGSWWLSQPERCQYDGGMRFMPDHDEKVVNETLNLWQGFAVTARKPNGSSGAAGCKLFLDHGLKIICNGDEAHYDYLIKREAFIAQKRTRSEVGVGLRTQTEGTGKGFWERTLNHLYGIHAMQVQNPDHVVGKHNKHLEVLLRLSADEALFALDPRHRNALYGLITEPEFTIEPKFIDVYSAKSHINIDIISNAEHFLPVSASPRRLFIPTVSSDRANDHEYFRKIDAQLRDGGGYEALLYHLLHEIDLRGFNVRAVPKTAMLAQQASYSRKGIDLLVEEACNTGLAPCPHQKWPGFSDCSGSDERRGFDYFIDHHSDRELVHIGALAVKRRLKEWGCVTGKATRKQSEGVRGYGVIWPPLAELREKFETKHGKQIWLCPEVTEWIVPFF